MLPVISIVGRSGTGKTVLIERLITEFKKRGYHVATVKHCLSGFEIDQPGKNSWRFAKAGSDAVLISSPDRLAFIKNVDHDPHIEEILHVIGSEFDFVLAEGFKQSEIPKIEVHRKELGDDLLCSVQVLSAIVSDAPLDIEDIPQFSLNDTTAVADFIEKNFIPEDRSDTFLSVNGKPVFIKPFVKDVIAKTLLAMVSTLKGIGKVKSLDISIKSKL